MAYARPSCGVRLSVFFVNWYGLLGVSHYLHLVTSEMWWWSEGKRILLTDQHLAIATNRCSANPGCCIHRQSSWLLQQRSVWHLFTSHSSTSDVPERCRLSGHWCWQIRTHHAGSSRRASLAPSATANTVQDSTLCVWLCPWALSCLLQQRLHPSYRHFWLGKSSFGRTPRRACPFNKNTARLTEFPRCSPNRLEGTFITASLHSSSISRGQFRTGLKTHLFTQAFVDIILHLHNSYNVTEYFTQLKNYLNHQV